METLLLSFIFLPQKINILFHLPCRPLTFVFRTFGNQSTNSLLGFNGDKISIITDSISYVYDIGKYCLSDYYSLIDEIQSTITKLKNNNIRLQWTSGYCGIYGNATADAVAKKSSGL